MHHQANRQEIISRNIIKKRQKKLAISMIRMKRSLNQKERKIIEVGEENYKNSSGDLDRQSIEGATVNLMTRGKDAASDAEIKKYEEHGKR